MTGSLPAGRRRAAMPRRGFSLVEIMVAIVLLSIGVIALASTAGAVLRLSEEGARATEAAAVAQTRFERMRATYCAQVVPGTYAATTGRIGEKYNVAVYNLKSFVVWDTVTFTVRRGTKKRYFRSVVRCRV